jgi:hypothetical protein
MTSPYGQADRLGICHAVGLFILILAAVAVLIVFVDAAQHSDPSNDKNAQLVRVFGFTRLSLVPAGRTMRMPDLPNPTVEWRFDPLLAGIQTDPADLILNEPD